ncbi:hypothetical protein EAE89_09035 [Photorhabdus heterorhabditis]|nr:hypothetical protein [Photorhabdus heterorhabditis]
MTVPRPTEGLQRILPSEKIKIFSFLKVMIVIGRNALLNKQPVSPVFDLLDSFSFGLLFAPANLTLYYQILNSP